MNLSILQPRTRMRMAFFFAFVIYNGAETFPSPAAVPIVEIAEKNADMFGAVRSLVYSGTQKSSFPKTTFAPTGGYFDTQETRVFFSSRGEKFSLTEKITSLPEGPSNDFTASYNGTLWQYFIHDVGRLFISVNHINSGPVIGSNLLFLPYTYLLFGKTEKDQINLWDTVTDYASKSRWADVLARATNVEATIDEAGRKLVKVTSKVTDPETGELSRTLVTTFSVADNFFPIRWQLFWDNSLADYAVNELAEVPISDGGSAFRFPKLATIKFSDSTGSTETVITIDSVQIDQPADDGEFTIDPAGAQNIHDIDSDVVITVPR
jgi:hypothetical protein